MNNELTSEAPFTNMGLIPAWMNNYIHYKMWDEIIYPFLHFSGATVELLE